MSYISVLFNIQSADMELFTTNLRVLKCLILIIFSINLSSCTTHASKWQNSKKNTDDSLSESRLRQKVIDYARTYLNKPYRKGGRDEKGFDCSGFVCHVLQPFNFEIPASSAEQFKIGKSCTDKEIKAGDLIFFGKGNKVNHVGIVTECKKNILLVIHSTSSKGVIEENILHSDYWLQRIQSVKSLDSYPTNKPLSGL